MTAATFDDLVTAATVGLSRRPLHVTELAGVAADHAGVLDRDDPATALLDAAALLTAARGAGALLPQAVTCPPPAAVDQAPELSVRAGRVLEQVAVADLEVLTDLLTTAARAGYRAPAPLLPWLLDAASRDRSLRPAVTGVLGTRGRWLASHHSGWAWVSDALPPEVPRDPDVWETGSRGERRAYLQWVRGRDAVAARDLLAAGWPQEAGDDRADLLAVLRQGLSTADEEFLEAALDDRKGAVRVTAAGLLACLPGSAFMRRAAGRAAPLLRLERHGLRQRLAVDLPEEADPAAARDGFSSRPPPGAGARAWLLTQVIAAAPLSMWVSRFGLAPAQIAAVPVAGNLGVDVHAGWRLAAVRQANTEWAEALLAAGPPSGASLPAVWPSDPELAGVVPLAARVARVLALLQPPVLSLTAEAEVVALPGPWPDSLAQAVMVVLARPLAAARRSRWPAQLVAASARNMPVTGPADYAAGLVGLAEQDNCPPALSVALYRAATMVVYRRTFLEEIR